MTSPQKSKRKRTQSRRKIEARAGMKLLKTEAAKLVQEWESDVGGQMAFVGISPSGKLFKIGHVDKLMDKFLCENQSSSEPTQNNLPVPVPVREQGPSNQQIYRDPEEIKADEEIKKYREELIQKKAELIKNMGDSLSDSEDDVGASSSDSESDSNSE